MQLDHDNAKYKIKGIEHNESSTNRNPELKQIKNSSVSYCLLIYCNIIILFDTNIAKASLRL